MTIARHSLVQTTEIMYYLAVSITGRVSRKIAEKRSSVSDGVKCV
jgi:hypothetical protein